MKEYYKEIIVLASIIPVFFTFVYIIVNLDFIKFDINFLVILLAILSIFFFVKTILRR